MNKFKKIIKAAIISLMVAFLFTVAITYLFFKIEDKNIEMAINLIDLITVKTNNVDNTQLVLNDNRKLENYPNYGTTYGNLIIEKIDVDLPIFYGESYSVLKKGIGHDSASYFPGEGGSIIYMGHNFKNYLARLPDLNKDDIIKLNLNYGEFSYKIYDTKIIDETDVDLVPIQNDEELLMIYTCYPINNIGHAYQRFVVYAKPID